MATKSILKTIHIKGNKSTLAFVNAYERAKRKQSVPVEMHRSYSDASAEEIRAMFGSNNDGL